jgi:cytochrome P450
MHTINPLSLPSHAAPYPFYRAIRERADFYFDTERQLWIASSAKIVREILSSADCVVRPPHDQIPANILGGSAGEVFAHLIRMNEGNAHQPGKQVLKTSLRTIDFSQTQFFSQQLLQELSGTLPLKNCDQLNTWLMRFPVSVVASICGFSRSALPQVAYWVSDFVACLSPLSSSEQVLSAHKAAAHLQASFIKLLQESNAQAASFLARLQTETVQQGWQSSDAIVCNLIGLLSQTYEATAGLIGNSIVTLHAMPALRDHLIKHPEELNNFIEEVVRFDPPVQNTRRFVTRDIIIGDQELKSGDAILLLLAAANRDPQVNLHPDEFQLHRKERISFTFSHGRHQCPGQQLALAISAYAVSYVLKNSTPAEWRGLQWQYRASLNGRIPVFTQTS